jgi:hypothetical protein
MCGSDMKWTFLSFFREKWVTNSEYWLLQIHETVPACLWTILRSTAIVCDYRHRTGSGIAQLAGIFLIVGIRAGKCVLLAGSLVPYVGLERGRPLPLPLQLGGQNLWGRVSSGTILAKRAPLFYVIPCSMYWTTEGSRSVHSEIHFSKRITWVNNHCPANWTMPSGSSGNYQTISAVC